MLRYDTSFKKSESSNASPRPAPAEPVPDPSGQSCVLPEKVFLRMLCLERKRTERSRRPFVLMLLGAAGLLKNGYQRDLLDRVIHALSRSTRETDITGWYEDGAVIGVLFTEIGDGPDRKSVTSALLSKVHNALAATLAIEQIDRIRISFHVYPENWDQSGPAGPADDALYPDFSPRNGHSRPARWIKRLMDITGSLLALVLLFPVMLLIAAVVKLTSRGPVLFRQERLGLHGARFQFLKFRSMYAANDSRIHEDYVKTLIAGNNAAPAANAARAVVYKMTADPRITPFGRFLRRTSLDELPQFFNVLVGEMSLVGPRPPVPYEVRHYDIWHKDRLLAATPGITGLWQVGGRSKVPFDEMVRMDLQYARSWSLWLDIKILCRTPLAVIAADGAF